MPRKEVARNQRAMCERVAQTMNFANIFMVNTLRRIVNARRAIGAYELCNRFEWRNRYPCSLDNR